jgi:predicted lipoprotein with Yx(FWY)xxD motif
MTALLRTLRLFIFVTTSVSLGMAQMTNEPTTLDTLTHPALGDYITDVEGKTLYIFLDDIDGTSHCYDTCAEQWPPLLASGLSGVNEGLNETLLSLTERQDGTSQVTYNGYPLYYFAGDVNPGDMNGQNWQDRWYVLSPEGYRLASEVEGEPTE